jgi:hypothetical protein
VPERLLELAARAGSPPIERRAMIWRARINTAMGDFRGAWEGYSTLADVGRVTSASDTSYNRSRLGYLEWVMEGDPSKLDDADALLAAEEDVDDRVGRDILISARSQIAFARGASAVAFDLAQQADYRSAVPHSFLFDIPIYSAFRLQDPERLVRAKANVPDHGAPRFVSLHAVAAASLAVLEDPSEANARCFLEVGRHHATVDGPLDEALMKAILAEVLPDSNAGASAGSDAHRWFTDHEANGYLGLFARVWDRLGIPSGA